MNQGWWVCSTINGGIDPQEKNAMGESIHICGTLWNYGHKQLWIWACSWQPVGGKARWRWQALKITGCRLLMPNLKDLSSTVCCPSRRRGNLRWHSLVPDEAMARMGSNTRMPHVSWFSPCGHDVPPCHKGHEARKFQANISIEALGLLRFTVGLS